MSSIGLLAPEKSICIDNKLVTQDVISYITKEAILQIASIREGGGGVCMIGISDDELNVSANKCGTRNWSNDHPSRIIPVHSAAQYCPSGHLDVWKPPNNISPNKKRGRLVDASCLMRYLSPVCGTSGAQTKPFN